MGEDRKKRIAGSFMLLAGLGGCISFTNPPNSKDKTPPRPGAQPSTSQVGSALVPPPPPQPPMPAWQPDLSQKMNGPAVDYRSTRPTLTTAWPPVPPNPTPPRMAPPMAPSPSGNGPEDMPDCSAGRATNSGPVVITPYSEPGAVRQASLSSPPEPPEPKILSGKPEVVVPATALLAPPRPQISLPPVPVVRDSSSAETTVAQTGSPLMRLVNTKRITLNFEVKDVGPSGLASVELWYTKDGREWKKHDAPTKAKAYVIEVDDEGMYGFTLLARSGTGMGKERPAAGDQPQVWVIVDLTKPDVQLADVTPDREPEAAAGDHPAGRRATRTCAGSRSRCSASEKPNRAVEGDGDQPGEYRQIRLGGAPSDAPGALPRQGGGHRPRRQRRHYPVASPRAAGYPDTDRVHRQRRGQSRPLIQLSGDAACRCRSPGVPLLATC